MPVGLATALGAEGHRVETVKSLRLAGIDNGALYALALREFDLLFTRDADFAKRAQESRSHGHFKLLRVVLEQKPQAAFVEDFMARFRSTRWGNYQNGDNWP